MTKPFRFLLCAFLLTAFAFTTAHAQAPRLINFQAQVDNLSTGSTPVVFSIYAGPAGGTPIWDETHNITSPDGVIQVLLGSIRALPEDIFSSDGERFLELNIDGEVLSPRFQLTSVAYALRSEVADALAGANVTSVNGLDGDLALKAGANVSITQSGKDITIASTLTGGDGSGGITTISGGSGIEVTDPNGPLAVVAIEENSLNDTQIADNSLTASSLANASVGSGELANGTAVRNINGLSDNVTLAGGSNVTLATDGQTITINAERGGTGGGISNLVAGNGITVENPSGPTSTVAIAQNGVGANEIGPNAVGSSEIQANAVGSDDLAANAVGSSEIQSNAVGSDEMQAQIVLGPNGSLATTNGSSQTVTSMGVGAAGGEIKVQQTNNGNFDAVELTVRNNGSTGLGGQIQIRGNENWDAIHMFSDGSTEGGRMLFREPVPGNANDAYTTLAFRGEDGKGHVIVLDDNSGSISIGGDQQEIRSRGKVGIGLTQAEYDSNSSLGPELFVRGNVSITGDLTGGTIQNSLSTSTIDHPQDPENKTLNHSGVISSERMTVYSGNIVLDNQGEATVQLPDWFESLNTNFRYQLTCIGTWARVYVAEKVNNNRFRIAGGREGLEVSWQITAVRNDPYAQENPIEVEAPKDASAQGTYINPEVYGGANN